MVWIVNNGKINFRKTCLKIHQKSSFFKLHEFLHNDSFSYFAYKNIKVKLSKKLFIIKKIV